MKAYFKRLILHPGFKLAILFTLWGGIAGMTNDSVIVWWHGALYGMSVIGVPIWSIVLYTNRYRP